jgi:protein-S-isoprenylcysteine O-methyltransferase Ste14
MSELLAKATIAVMIAGWFGFSAGFILRKRQARGAAAKRDWPSVAGLVLQMVGYSITWSVQRRPPTRPWLGSGVAWQAVFLALVGLLASWSVWAMMGAVRALGKQWSLQARVLEDHELITSGPFQRVRHPIYSAMLAMLIASSFAIGDWRGLAVGLPVCALGTWLRVRGEERLLSEVFGARYAEYTARVPALVPRWPPRRA